MIKRETLRHLVVPVTIALGLGASACGSSRDETGPRPTVTTTVDCPNPRALTDVRLIGASKDGSTNAVNGGECAAVYDPNTLQTIGRVASEQGFNIICIAFKPTAFEVKADGVQGKVNLDTNLINDLNLGTFAAIPDCQ